MAIGINDLERLDLASVGDKCRILVSNGRKSPSWNREGVELGITHKDSKGRLRFLPIEGSDKQSRYLFDGTILERIKD